MPVRRTNFCGAPGHPSRHRSQTAAATVVDYHNCSTVHGRFFSVPQPEDEKRVKRSARRFEQQQPALFSPPSGPRDSPYPELLPEDGLFHVFVELHVHLFLHRYLWKRRDAAGYARRSGRRNCGTLERWGSRVYPQAQQPVQSICTRIKGKRHERVLPTCKLALPVKREKMIPGAGVCPREKALAVGDKLILIAHM